MNKQPPITTSEAGIPGDEWVLDERGLMADPAQLRALLHKVAAALYGAATSPFELLLRGDMLVGMALLAHDLTCEEGGGGYRSEIFSEKTAAAVEQGRQLSKREEEDEGWRHLLSKGATISPLDE